MTKFQNCKRKKLRTTKSAWLRHYSEKLSQHLFNRFPSNVRCRSCFRVMSLSKIGPTFFYYHEFTNILRFLHPFADLLDSLIIDSNFPTLRIFVRGAYWFYSSECYKMILIPINTSVECVLFFFYQGAEMCELQPFPVEYDHFCSIYWRDTKIGIFVPFLIPSIIYYCCFYYILGYHMNMDCIYIYACDIWFLYGLLLLILFVP